MALAPSAATAQIIYAPDTPLAIPDNDPAGIVSTLVTSNLFLWDTDVFLNVSHTWVGDLVITLEHADTTVVLLDRPGLPATTYGCSANDIVAFADDEGGFGSFEAACAGQGSQTQAYVHQGRYTPNTPLSAFDGRTRAGAWTLRVVDYWPTDSGTLAAWGIQRCCVGNEGEASERSNTLELLSGNPATGRVQFALTVAEAQEVRVGLYDLLGRSVRPVLDRALTAGTEVYMEVNVADLAAGVYVLRAEGGRLLLSRTLALR